MRLLHNIENLRRYLKARAFKLTSIGKTSNALFPPTRSDSEFLSYKRIRTLKSFVEDDLGEKFELRKCRRTFGQRALNEGQDIHNVSLVMGHTTLVTTQRYYCDKEPRVASNEMRDFWAKNTVSEGN